MTQNKTNPPTRKIFYYTDKELSELEKMKEDLIIWLFHSPNDSYPIMVQLKKAFQLGMKHKEVTSNGN